MPVPRQKPHRSKQDYCTPPWFLAAVKRLLGITQFAFDLAADAENSVAGSCYYNEEQDALSQDWRGLWRAIASPGDWFWLNPPFRNIDEWAAQCDVCAGWHGAPNISGMRIALLVPASVGSNWYQDSVERAAMVLFLHGRLSFLPDKPTWLYPKDCMLALYGLPPGSNVWDWRIDA